MQSFNMRTGGMAARPSCLCHSIDKCRPLNFVTKDQDAEPVSLMDMPSMTTFNWDAARLFSISHAIPQKQLNILCESLAFFSRDGELLCQNVAGADILRLRIGGHRSRNQR